MLGDVAVAVFAIFAIGLAIFVVGAAVCLLLAFQDWLFEKVHGNHA